MQAIRSKLNLLVFGVALLIFEHMAAAFAATISTGDYLFIKAKVIGCGPEIRIIEAGRVTEAGTLTVFRDIELDAAGKTTDELTSVFVAEWKTRTGQQSKTIEIMMIPAADPETATMLMMNLYFERRRGCPSPYRDWDLTPPDWERFFQIADAPAICPNRGRTTAHSMLINSIGK